MPTIIKAASTALVLLCCLVTPPAAAEALKPYAVEFRTGPAWDSQRPAHEQAHFREHGANLQALRASGRLAMGAITLGIAFAVDPTLKLLAATYRVAKQVAPPAVSDVLPELPEL